MDTPVTTAQDKPSTMQESLARLQKARREFHELHQADLSDPFLFNWLRDHLETAVACSEEWLELGHDNIVSTDLRLLISALQSEHRRVVRLGRELKGREGT